MDLEIHRDSNESEMLSLLKSAFCQAIASVHALSGSSLGLEVISDSFQLLAFSFSIQCCKCLVSIDDDLFAIRTPKDVGQKMSSQSWDSPSGLWASECLAFFHKSNSTIHY